MPKSEAAALAFVAAALCALLVFACARDEAGLRRAAVAAPIGATQV